MSSDDLQVIVLGVVEIAAFAGALGAIAVLAMLSLLSHFTDWFIEREQRHQRIAAARARSASASASEVVSGRWGGACDTPAHRHELSAATLQT